MKRKIEKPDWVDILLASTIAAWATIVTAMALVSLTQVIVENRPGGVLGWIAMLLPTIFIGFLFAIIVCVAVGLPALGLVYWLKLTRWWQWTAMGASGGLLVLLVPVLPVPVNPVSVAPAAALFGFSGALAGFAAWREARKANST